MAPQQIIACGVAACLFATVASLTGPGQDVAKGLRCVLTEDARLDELESVGQDALQQFRSVRGPERISHCTEAPDVAVVYYLSGNPRHVGRWRAEVDRELDAHAASDRDAYELTTRFPVRSADGYVLPVTVTFAGHPRWQPTD